MCLCVCVQQRIEPSLSMSAPTVTKDEYELAQIEFKRLSAHHTRAIDDAQRQSTEMLMHQQEHIMRAYETLAVQDANLRTVGGGRAPRKVFGVRSIVPKHSKDVVARGNPDYENDGAAGGGGGGDGGGYGDGLGGGGMGDQGAKRKRTVRSPLEVWTERAGAATQLILDHEARLAKYRASIAKLNTRIARLRADGVGMLADDPLLVQLANEIQKQTTSEVWLIKQRVLLSTAEEKLRDVAVGKSTRRAVVSRVGAAPSGSGKTKKGGDLDAHSETDAAGGDEDNNPFVTEAQRLVRRCATMKKLEAIPKGDLKALHRAIHALLVQCKKRLVRYHAQREWANRGFQREDKARIRANVDYMYGVAKQAKRGKTTQPDSHTLLVDKVNTWLELQRERRVLERQQRHYKEGNDGANSEAISDSLRALDERWTVFHLAVITNNERTTQGLQVTLERAFYRVCCLRKGKQDVTRKADEARAEAVRAAGEHVLFLMVPTRADKAGVKHWDALAGRGKETVEELKGKELKEFTRIAETHKKKKRGSGEGGGGGDEGEKSNSEDSGGGEGGTQFSRLELSKFLNRERQSAPDTAYIFSNSEEEEEEDEEAVQRVVHQGAGRWGKQQQTSSSSSSSSSSDSDELVHSSGSKAGSASGGGGGGSGSMLMGGGGRAHRPEADAYRATGVSGVPLSNRWIAGYQTRLSSDPVKAKQFELNNARLTLEAVVGELEGDSSAEGHRKRHEAQVRLGVVRAEYVAVMTEKWRGVRAADAAAGDIDDVRARLHALKGRLDDATAAVTQSGIQCDGWVHRLHSVGGDATPYEQEQAALAQEDLRIMKARFQERLREWTFTFEAAKPDTDDEAEEDGSNHSDSLSESEDADSEAIGDASDAEESGSGNEEEEDEDEEEETGQDPMAYDSGRSARTEARFGSLLARTGMPFRAAASNKSSFEAKGKEALAEALQAERDAIAHDRRMTKRRQTRLSGGGRATDVQDQERLAKGASATLVWQPEKKTLCLQLWDRNDAFGWVSFANVKRTVRQQIRIGKGEYEADPQHPGSVSEKQLYDAREEENEDDSEEENDSVNNPGALFKQLADMRLHLGALYFHSTFQVDTARKGQSGPVLTINCGTRKAKSGEKVRITVTEVLEIGFFPQNALLFAPWDPQDASAWLMRKHIAWQLSMHTLRKAAQSQSFMGKLMRYASAAAKRGYTRLLENTEDETMPALTKSTLFDFLRRGMLISNNDTACVALQSHRDPYSETHVPANPARRRRRGAAAPRKKTKKAPAASDDVMRTALQFYAARM